MARETQARKEAKQNERKRGKSYGTPAAERAQVGAKQPLKGTREASGGQEEQLEVKELGAKAFGAESSAEEGRGELEVCGSLA